MTHTIGYCGYNCHLCAARSDDPDVRQRLVDGWRKIFGHQNYTAENVKCDGCLSDGRVADQDCQARPCAKERGVENCAACDEFPCNKMKHLMASSAGMLIWCHPRIASLTEEEYNLCIRQFDSMPNLVRMLARVGRLPPWVADGPEAHMGEEFNVYVEHAVNWARMHLESADYAFLCLAFVEDAYERSNDVEIFGGSCAKESADEYAASENTGTPPAGAFVFYDCFGPVHDEHKNWGHVGLSLGQGQVIHAWDRVRIDDYLDIQNLTPAPGWTKPQFIGWAPVERIFVGYRKKAWK